MRATRKTAAAVERAVNGGKGTLVSDDTTVETGRSYDIRVEVCGRKADLCLDGERWGGFTEPRPEPFRQVVTRDERTGELILKVVNAQADAARTAVDLGVPVAPTARVTTLQGDPGAENTATDRPIRPETSRLEGVGATFTHTFPAHSVTFVRLRPER